MLAIANPAISLPHGLGCKSSKFDPHDYPLTAYIPIQLGDLSGEKEWPFNQPSLNQGTKPWCVGYGIADFGINAPIEDVYTNTDGDNFYHLCKLKDGDGEEGSTVRTAAKVLRDIGRIQAYAFATSVNEVVYWLLNKGSMMAGTQWTVDMFTPDKNNIIHPTGEVAGGHCYLLNAKYKTNLIRVRCAWTDDWGIRGEALISIDDFAKLFRAGGEVLAAVEEPLDITTENVKGCKEILQEIFRVPVI